MPARKPDTVKAMLGTLRRKPVKPRSKPSAPAEPTLSAVDQTLLDGLLSDRTRIRAELASVGTTYTGRNGVIKQHPAAVQLRQIEAAILRLSGRASRTSKPTTDHGDPLATATAGEREWIARELKTRLIYFHDSQTEADLLAELRGRGKG